MVGTGKGAENGILIRNLDSLEMAHNINTVVFDKTGTLTKGKPEVTDIVQIPTSLKLRETNKNEDILQLAASLEKGSEHLLAEAIINKAKKEKIVPLTVNNFKAFLGMGIEGMIDNKMIFFGNKKLMDKNKIDTYLSVIQVDQLEQDGKTVMFLAQDKVLVGLIAVTDVVKESAKEAIKMLNKNKIETIMLTGDSKKAAQAIGKKIGIKKIISQVLPDGKEKEIRKLKSQDRVVAMIGDGVNDAPALVAADLSLAMGTGTDVTIESADITLVNKDLHSVLQAIRLSKETMNTIKLNLFWASIYNIILIPVAMGILYPFFKITLNPILASAAMGLSSVSVVSSSLLLRFRKI
jgi:Cu+-exporting ATPase